MISSLVLIVITLPFFILSLVKVCKLNYDENCDEKVGYTYVLAVSLAILVFSSIILISLYRFNGAMFI